MRELLPAFGSALSFRDVKTLGCVAIVLALGACSADHGVTQVTPPRDTASTPVIFAGGTITASIAAVAAARERGLMNVTALGPNAGMLFVFGIDRDSTTVAFYMKDTPIDLSIAFINASRTVVSVAEMTAEDSLTLHKPMGAIRYALEANKGWMTAHGVAAGTTATFTLPAGTIIDP